MLCGKKHWQGLKGEICFYCLLMRAFDVALLFAVCTPGSLGLHSDELSAGEGEAGGGRLGIFQVTLSSQLLLLCLAWEGNKSSSTPFVYPPTSVYGAGKLP